LVAVFGIGSDMRISGTVIGAVAGVLLVGAIGGAALLYANPGRNDKAADLSRYAAGSLARLETPGQAEPPPDHRFLTADGASTVLSDFRGRVVVVNLWAMWCAPCRTEMPTLARLAETYAGTDLTVLPINVDATPEAIEQARDFIDAQAPLPFYSDPEFQLPFQLPGKGRMPQTVLLDRQGRIRAHLAGEADWSGPEARALVDALLAEPPSA